MEIELGWGVHDIGNFSHLSRDGSAERTYLRRLLDHCDLLELPMTFNVAGHLCESSCEGSHDGPHPDGWFAADPGTDADTDPLFYAPETARAVTDRETAHELCTHTYSHVPCDSVSEATVRWELQRAQSQLRRLTGSKTVSLVPPRHDRPPAGALRDADIETLRLARDTSDRSRPARLKELVYGPHPTFEPVVVDDIAETYCTTYPSLTSSALPSGQREPPAFFRLIPVSTRQTLQRQYLSRAVDAAVETEGHCHLWCHLYDLSNEYQWPIVRSFCEELAARRERGEIRVLTMATLNDHLRADDKPMVARPASHG